MIATSTTVDVGAVVLLAMTACTTLIVGAIKFGGKRLMTRVDKIVEAVEVTLPVGQEHLRSELQELRGEVTVLKGDTQTLALRVDRHLTTEERQRDDALELARESGRFRRRSDLILFGL